MKQSFLKLAVLSSFYAAKAQRHLVYWIENTTHNDSVSGASVKYKIVKPENFVSLPGNVEQNIEIAPAP